MRINRTSTTRTADGNQRYNKGKPRELCLDGRLSIATMERDHGAPQLILLAHDTTRGNEIDATVHLCFSADETARIRRLLLGSELLDDLEAFASDYAHGLGPDVSRLHGVIARVKGDNA